MLVGGEAGVGVGVEVGLEVVAVNGGGRGWAHVGHNPFIGGS